MSKGMKLSGEEELDPLVLLKQFEELMDRAKAAIARLHATSFRIGDKVFYTSLKRKGVIKAFRTEAQVQYDDGNVFWQPVDQYLILCESEPLLDGRSMPHEAAQPTEAKE